ncbi:MAG: cysteine synthase family protein, partial [Gemmatimonadota bacterium]
VQLNRVAGEVQARILMKLEWYGPSGSLKDRIYLRMFEEAERAGQLEPGMTVLECSTGNAGTACACIAAVKGYRCIIVMPSGMSEERRKLVQAYGAELVLTPGAESDVDLSLAKLEELRQQDPDRFWVPGQFDNAENTEAHYETTGPEIWQQCEGRIDGFVVSQGSGGTLTGAGRYLRERDPQVRLYAVEPAECPILSRRKWGPHGIEGIGDGFVPVNLDVSLLTGVITVSTGEAVEMARRLAQEEGLFCGISSGCNVAAAVKLGLARPDLRTIVTLANDTGQRYFSTALCGEEKELDIPERDHVLDQRSLGLLDRYQHGWEVVR